MKRTVFAILTIILCLYSMPSWGDYWNTVSVDWCVSTSGSDSNNGQSWTSPKKTIGAAMFLANSGDVIGVAAGTYNESIRLTEGVTLLGEGASTTEIRSSIDIVLLARQAESGMVSGFTLRYTGTSGHSTVVLENSSVTITESVITGARYSGLDIRGASVPQITNNEIRNNLQSGIIILSGATPTISGNIISGNQGRGMSIYSGTAAQITYNTIVYNTYEGIQVDKNSPSVISNNIIVRNGLTTNTVGLSTVTEPDPGCGPSVSYNDVWGNGWGDYEGIEKPATDISVDPLFVDAASSDYHLQNGSPCRGAASNGGDLGAYSSLESVEITLDISPDEATLNAGTTQQFTVDRTLIYYKDLNTNGRYDLGEASSLIEDENTSIEMTWDVEGGIGTISNGLFTAKYAGNGKITATQTSDPSVTGETGTITVEAGTLATLTMSSIPTRINAGETHQFTVSGEDVYGNSIFVEGSDVTWSVTGDIGTIDSTGIFTATAVGTGSIGAALKANPNITAQSATFTVESGDVATMAISQTALTLKLDETHQFIVTAKDEHGNGVSVGNENVTWSVNDGIGTISSEGVFYATAMGTGSVTATFKADSSITAESGNITVVAGEVATLTMSASPWTLTAGETNQFTVSGADKYGNSVSVENSEVSWAVNGGIGTVSTNGLFSAITAGMGNVKATLKTNSSITVQSGAITVEADVLATLTISQSPSSLEAGETHQFTIAGADAYDNSIIVGNSQVSWSVSGGIGTVSSMGLFSAITSGTGTVVITLKTDSSITATSETITVEAGDVTSITISAAPSQIKAGETNQFTFAGLDAYGNNASVADSDVSWTVNGGIGTVSLTGLFSATTVGSGTVTVTLNADSSITATCDTFTVDPGNVATLTMSQAPLALKLDETHQFTVTGVDAYGNSVPLLASDVSWFVNDGIGTVSSTGLFTATALGTGNVEATLKANLSIAAVSEDFSVVEGNVAKLTMSLARPTVRAGRSYQFIILGEDAYGNRVTVVDDEVAWSVIGGIGTISTTGLFTANTVGTGTAIATLKIDPSVTVESGTITVEADTLAVLIISQPPSSLKAGETHQFTVTGADAYGNSVSVGNSSITWSVIDGIGTISTTGLFTATTAGTGNVKATLKADSSVKMESEDFTVEAGSIASLAISQSPSTLKAGETYQFAVTGADTYGNNVSIGENDVSWSVAGSIGTISEAGLFSASTVGTGTVKVALNADSSITSESESFTVEANVLAVLTISQPPSTLTAGETHQFTITGADAYGNSVPVEASDVLWSVADGIGDISEAGLFSAITSGMGKVEVSAESVIGVSASTELFTVEADETDTITVESSTQDLFADSVSQADITATLMDVYNNPVTTETVDVSITAGTGSLGAVINNGDGTYTATYTAGQEAGVVEIQFTTSNGKSAEISFTLIYLHTLSSLPESGTAGEAVVVTGEDFEENEKAGVLTLDGEVIAIDPVGDTVVSGVDIYADDSGKFVVQFVIPKLPGGIHYISIDSNQIPLEIKGEISISRIWGGAGGTVEVTGDGFGQNESIGINFGDTQDIALAMSGSDGSFQTSFSVDAQDAGQKSVVAMGATSGISAEAVFEIMPVAISLEPATGKVGSSVELTGTGFRAQCNAGKPTIDGAEIQVTGVGGTTILFNNIWTDDNGAFVVTFSMPTLLSGSHLIAVGDAKGSFVIEAQILSVQPTSGLLGSTVSVAGDGFGAAEIISVDFGNTFGIAAGTTLSDGSFQISFEVDDQETGTNKITVSGMTSGMSAAADFELTQAPPSVTLTSTCDEWVSGTLIVEAEADDVDGVISEVLFQYSPDNVTWYDIGTDETSPYTANWDTKVGLSAVQNSLWIKAVATDEDGLTNEDVIGAPFGVDNEPPESLNDYDGTWRNEDFPVTLTGDDGSGSGIASINYIVNDGGSMSVQLDECPIIDVEGNNSKIEYWSVDKVGNEEAHRTLTGIKLDKTPPTLSDWTAEPEELKVISVGDFYIRLRVADNLSGQKVPQIAYHISSSYGDYSDMIDDGDGYWTFSISEDWSDYPDETLYYKVKLADNAGNEITEEKSILIHDKWTSAITANLSQSEMLWNGDIIVSGSITDPSDPQNANADFGSIIVDLTFTPPGGAEQHKEKVQTLSTLGNYSLIFSESSFSDLAKHTGTWKVKASWSGNDFYKGNESQEQSFEVTKITTEITWDQGIEERLEIIDEGSISLSGKIEPNPGSVDVMLSITLPDGSSDSESGEISAQGTFAFDPEIDARGEWIFTVSWAGNDEYSGASTDEHTLEVVRTIGKAIIVHGGGNSSENDTFEALNTLADHIYEVFAQRRLTDNDIYYLSPDQQDQKADAVTSLSALEHAVTTWAPGNLTSDLSLYICVLTHNRPEQGLVIEKQNGTEVLLTAETLDGWLDQIQGNFKDITVLIEASYSEEFIESLRGPGRVIITSSQRDSRAVVMQNISFSKYLFDNVYGNKNLRDAFQEARSELALRKRLFGNQTPQLDADGDGVTNEDEDMSALQSKYIDGNYESEGSPAELPEVLQVCEDQELNEGENEAPIWAIVSSASEISRVWGTIVPPDFAENTSETESFLSDANLLTVDLKFAKDNRYEAVLGSLDKTGIYTLLIYAENAEGVSIPMITLITVPEKQAVDADGKLAKTWGDMKNSDATEAIPSRSGMGQNYPNPFNPETWIPYQLRKSAHVEVRIYAPSGKLVRMLELGHKMAGFYVDKQKAAYWDGRNETGEFVASGVYFYSIHAGEFAAVRKLIVVR